ncbi:MAG TPA: hypothetical protein VK619_04495 [Pyrinomonadaceae bacterium]|nr:hypothetical protein [Pyrinomonadaceae bacterium]
MTRQLLSLALGLAFALALQGCSSTSDNTGNTATSGNTTKTTTTNSATTTSTQTASTAGSIGVPECDEYLTKYEVCLNQHVPEASRAQMRAAFEQTRTSWKQAASTPQGKAGLAAGCKQILDAAKQQTAAYGCQW